MLKLHYVHIDRIPFYKTAIPKHAACLDIPIKQWKFPSGEVGVKIECDISPNNNLVIELLWEGNDDLIALGQLVDAIRFKGVDTIYLDILYFPYSRQDRRCHSGEGHSLKMTAQYINSLNFKRVRTLDPHSSVLEALVDNLWVKTQAECAYDLPVYDYLIAPDAGASKKIYTHKQVLNDGTKVLVAEKTRGSDGSITGMTIHWDGGDGDLDGKSVCVVDDLCDGGATFIAVAQALAKIRFRRFDLYVTHGFFTKGPDELFKHYWSIYTANLMNPALKGKVFEI